MGPVYAAAVSIPRDGSFDCSMVKDSKRFHSAAKLRRGCLYIKENSLAWAIAKRDAEYVDTHGIRSACMAAMHDAILDCQRQLHCGNTELHLLVDGSDFKPLVTISNDGDYVPLNFTTVTKGDNTFASIAAASMLAKASRDDEIDDICRQHPVLNERYGWADNKGYGTRAHIEGLEKHGPSLYHRKSFARCS